MEKPSSGHREDMCEKIYKAVTACPFQTICCITDRQQEPTSASPAPNSSTPTSVKTTDIQYIPDSAKHPKSEEAAQLPNTTTNREAVEVVPINFVYSSQLPPHERTNSATAHVSTKNNGQVAKPAVKIQPEATTTNNVDGQSPDQETKANHRAESTQVNKGVQKSGVHIEDRFTEYIHRAKIKIRTMSNVGDSKNAPGKDQASAKEHASAKDKFSDYINRVKIKLRSTSGIGVGRSSSFK